jgi:hypothetical protein
MTLNLLFYQFLLVALALICLMVHLWWPDNPRITPQMASIMASATPFYLCAIQKHLTVERTKYSRA